VKYRITTTLACGQ